MTTSQSGQRRSGAPAPPDRPSRRAPGAAADDVPGGFAALGARNKPGATRGIVRTRPVRLTGRGGVLAVFAISFAGALAASASHLGVLAGLSYVAGCVFAAWAVRPSQLLPVVATPPMLLGAAVVCVQAITASAGVLSVAEGTLVTLGNVAPWLFAGTAAGLVIALARGMAGNVRALRESLRGDSHDRGRPRGETD